MNTPLSTPLRVTAFVATLAAAFAVAWGGVRLVGPIDTEPVAHEGAADHGGDEGEAEGHGEPDRLPSPTRRA